MKFLLLLATFLALVTAPSHAAGRARSKGDSLLPPVPKPTEPATPGKLFTTSLGGKDLRFLSDAIEHGLGQVFLATLAGTHAQSDRVKALANVLSQTQREENSKLSRLAAMKDVALGDRDAAAQEGFARKLSQLPKEKFDSAWIEEVVALNQRAVANYTEAVSSTDPDIKMFAQKALPLAKEKLALVSGGGAATPAPAFRNESSQPKPR